MFSSSDLSLLWFVTAGIATVLTANVVVAQRKRTRGLPYWPGPKGQPIVGNLSQIPRDKAWLVYQEMCREYGGMARLTALGTEILVVASVKHAKALLDKRAVNYSDRPDLIVSRLSENEWSFALMGYGDDWRQHRRAFHQYFNQNAVPKYRPIFYEERKAMLDGLRDDPQNWREHITSFFGTTLIRTTYGFDDKDKNASLVHTAETLVREFGIATEPGMYLVETFRFLRHVPEWLPGTAWKQYMRDLAKLSNAVVYPPFEDAKMRLARGERAAYANVVVDLIDKLPSVDSPDRPQAELLAKNVCALAYIAGAESSTAVGLGLVAALANNPQIQKNAQAELDAVVGDRQPLVDDRSDLPYVHAVVKELVRWYSAAPIGVPHVSSEDDEYEGHFIPKGTLVTPNIWAMMHDPEIFERPHDFYPERFLKDGMLDPSVPDPAELAAFGFGRRVCPGRHMSREVLFLYAASLLANFDVHPPKDSNGNPIEVKIQMGNGPVAMPAPFECYLTVRPGRESMLA